MAIEGGTFAWPGVKSANDSKKGSAKSAPSTNSPTPKIGAAVSGDDYIALKNINLTVKKGELVGICGAVGSGKSSIISAILAQMKTVKGRVCRTGKVSYVSQQAWIQSASLRENILFGEVSARPAHTPTHTHIHTHIHSHTLTHSHTHTQAYDEARYERVIDVCCLKHDLHVLPAGDRTEIGERGINLSGGQRQRVSMARAAFVSGDVLLLDDPLSAVDAHVGKRIFEKCIRGELKGKTVIFVTHQLQYLPKCDRVVFVENGEIAVGTYKDLHASNTRFAELMQHNEQREPLTEEEMRVEEEEEREKERKEDEEEELQDRKEEEEAQRKKEKEREDKEDAAIAAAEDSEASQNGRKPGEVQSGNTLLSGNIADVQTRKVSMAGAPIDVPSTAPVSAVSAVRV